MFANSAIVVFSALPVKAHMMITYWGQWLQCIPFCTSSVCVCVLFGLNVIFNNLSVISQQCLFEQTLYLLYVLPKE